MQKPIYRTPLRLTLGMAYYGTLRKLYWVIHRKQFAHTFCATPLPYLSAAHKTLLRRKLKNVEMYLQENKITNLQLAAIKTNGIVLRPGETFSYWNLVGKPTKAKGYLDGMILRNGTFAAGTGGGLCQLTNLIFWMAIHTPLTITERHRHGYDVFPDSNRTQFFGSGATCFYPHGDLMIQNNTTDTYQLIISVGKTHLHGEWRCSAAPIHRYKIVERNHEMKAEFWGGYSRHNEIYQQKFDLDGVLLEETLVVKNAALMMYAPLLESTEHKP